MRKQNGFTLIELMVIVAILGVLAATLVPQMNGMITKAKEARTTAELVSIKNAMGGYLADVGSYPPSVQDFGRNWGDDVGLVDRTKVHVNHVISWQGPYLNNWPTRTAWASATSCGWSGAYYIHIPIGWINRDGIDGNDYWIHMNPDCGAYPPSSAASIDRVIDDGNAGSGEFRVTGGRYIYFYIGEGLRSW